LRNTGLDTDFSILTKISIFIWTRDHYDVRQHLILKIKILFVKKFGCFEKQKFKSVRRGWTQAVQTENHNRQLVYLRMKIKKQILLIKIVFTFFAIMLGHFIVDSFFSNLKNPKAQDKDRCER